MSAGSEQTEKVEKIAQIHSCTTMREFHLFHFQISRFQSILYFTSCTKLFVTLILLLPEPQFSIATAQVCVTDRETGSSIFGWGLI